MVRATRRQAASLPRFGFSPSSRSGVAALRRELCSLSAVQVVEAARHAVTRHELLLRDQWLEQPPAHDFEAFFGAGWSPRRLDTPDDVAQSVERIAPTLAADLGIIG